MKEHVELGRFSANGKTFFLNKGEAKNGSEYLVINAIYGQGRQERLILFPAHYIEFKKHFDQALEGLTGARWDQKKDRPACPDCGMPKIAWRTRASKDGSHWIIYCSECDEVIDMNHPGAMDAMAREAAE